MILERVSPVTHSVANCVKRVVVIVTSVLFFKTPVSPLNSLGKFMSPLFFLDEQRFPFSIHHINLYQSWLIILFSPTFDYVILLGSVGTGVALAGVFLYSRVKRIKTKFV